MLNLWGNMQNMSEALWNMWKALLIDLKNRSKELKDSQNDWEDRSSECSSHQAKIRKESLQGEGEYRTESQMILNFPES